MTKVTNIGEEKYFHSSVFLQLWHTIMENIVCACNCVCCWVYWKCFTCSQWEWHSMFRPNKALTYLLSYRNISSVSHFLYSLHVCLLTGFTARKLTWKLPHYKIKLCKASCPQLNIILSLDYLFFCTRLSMVDNLHLESQFSLFHSNCLEWYIKRGSKFKCVLFWK